MRDYNLLKSYAIEILAQQILHFENLKSLKLYNFQILIHCEQAQEFLEL